VAAALGVRGGSTQMNGRYNGFRVAAARFPVDLTGCASS
jgi:hypothetical protein